MNAIVLLSGGLDSTTMLAMVREELPPENILALSIHYGQTHEVELQAADAVAEHYSVEWEPITLNKSIFEGTNSTVVADNDLPQPENTYKELMESEGPSATYVPFRNANLLSAATSVALVRGASVVYFGAHAEDAHNWAYPDCTPEFIGSMASAIYVGSYHSVRLATPLEWMMKKDIVAKGLDLNVPFQITHSCYAGKRPACGKCPTCVERLEAFSVNGAVDPLEYE